MGQPVTVIEKPSATPGVVRFELNRTLSGMGHESFRSVADAVGPTPSAELARRLFEHGGVDSVHVYANVITVQLDEGAGAAGLKDIVEDLHLYYVDGVTPAAPPV
jgi:L-fucose mutarotase/ribose pyranase (RbsD/FucU family)